jgi:iron complex outermembrane receptor protein
MSERSPRDEVKGFSAVQYIVLSVCLLAAGIGSALAENAGDSLVRKDTSAVPAKDLGRMVVFGTQITQYSPSQTVLEAKDFRGNFQDLGSVLETVSGVTVREMGGFGHYAEAAVRGSSANQVQVYLDGIPLNGASGDAVDISKIPLLSLQKITIYKNDPPIEFFGDNAGGVINLSSASAGQSEAGLLEFGSFGYKSASASLNAKTGRVSHCLSINYGYADNDYSFLNDRGTTIGPTSGNDDTVEAMDNNFYSTFSSFYSNTWNVDSKNTLTSRLSADVSNEGIFYYPMVDSNDGSIKTSTICLSETYQAAIDSTAGVTITASGRTQDEQIARFEPYYLTTPIRESISQPYGGLEAIVRKKLWSLLSLAAVAKGGYDGFNMDNLLAGGGKLRPDFFRLSAKAGAEAQLCIPSGLSARVGGIARYERDSTNGSFLYGDFVNGGQTTRKWFPGVYSDVQLGPLHGFDLYAGIRYDGRSPGFSEKFVGGANVSGNPQLRPEMRLEYETGFSLNKRLISFSGSLFASDTKDKIVFAMNSAHIFYPRNMDDIAGWGSEVDLTAAPLDWIAVTNSVSYLENTIRSSAVTSWNGKDEPFVPRFSDDLRVRLSCRSFHAGHGAHFRSAYFVDPDNTVKNSNDTPELSAWIGLVPDSQKHFDLSYRIENYLNVRNYDFPGRPVPGIRHYLVCKCTF